MGDDHHAHHTTTGDLLWIVQGCAYGVFLTWFPWSADGDEEGYICSTWCSDIWCPVSTFCNGTQVLTEQGEY